MFKSIEIQEQIRDSLQTAYTDANKDPYITITLFPVGESGNAELEKEAKAKSDNGAVYIGMLPAGFDEPIGGLYDIEFPFIVLIYSNNKDMYEIYELFEIALINLIKITQITGFYPCDVKGYKSGLYMAYITCLSKPFILG